MSRTAKNAAPLGTMQLNISYEAYERLLEYAEEFNLDEGDAAEQIINDWMDMNGEDLIASHRTKKAWLFQNPGKTEADYSKHFNRQQRRATAKLRLTLVKGKKA